MTTVVHDEHTLKTPYSRLKGIQKQTPLELRVMRTSELAVGSQTKARPVSAVARSAASCLLLLLPLRRPLSAKLSLK